MVEKPKILLVDDEADIREFLEFSFSKEGFEVETAGNGNLALKTARKFKPDVIILDVMMPEINGIEVCEHIRDNDEFENPIIIMLTARGEDFSQMAGFNAGSNDYVVKPVSPKILIAKVKALLILKNENLNSASNINIADNNLIINKDFYAVYKNKQEINLPKKEFEILSYMAAKPNRLFSREEIFNHIWGNDTFVGERTMDVYIRNIRSKIGDNYIKTVKGVGYKFVQH